MNGPTASSRLKKSETRRYRMDARKQYWHDTFRLWRRNRLMVLGTIIIVSLLLVAAAAPLLATHGPFDQISRDRLTPPSSQYWFGTDSLGRDIYSRVIYGSRVTLMIAVLVAAISTPVAQ